MATHRMIAAWTGEGSQAHVLSMPAEKISGSQCERYAATITRTIGRERLPAANCSAPKRLSTCHALAKLSARNTTHDRQTKWNVRKMAMARDHARSRTFGTRHLREFAHQ